jgi:hypothetical protein
MILHNKRNKRIWTAKTPEHVMVNPEALLTNSTEQDQLENLIVAQLRIMNSQDFIKTEAVLQRSQLQAQSTLSFSIFLRSALTPFYGSLLNGYPTDVLIAFLNTSHPSHLP